MRWVRDGRSGCCRPGCRGGAARPDALDRPAGPGPAAEAAGRGGGRAAGGPGGRRRAAAAPGPAVRLPRAGRAGRVGPARVPGAGAVRRPAGRRLPARAGRHLRAPRPAGPAAQGRLARAGAQPRGGAAGPRGGRPLRRVDGRRAAARRPAAAREGRGPGVRGPRRSGTPARIRAAGRAIPAGRRSWTRCTRAAHPAPSGRRCPAPPGRTRSPCWPPPPLAGGRGALVVVPDHRDVDRVAAARRPGRSAPGGDGADRRRRPGRPATRRWLAVRRGAHPGGRRHPGRDVRAGPRPRAWSWSGTTATTCTTSRARRTRTSARCSRCAPGWRVPPWWWAASPARRRRPRWSGPAGPRTSRPPATRCAGWLPSVRGISDEVDPRDPAGRAARLPTLAWRTAAQALEHGPVLVQVPRAGYVPGLACATCRAPARCAACAGPLGSGGRGVHAGLPVVRGRRHGLVLPGLLRHPAARDVGRLRTYRRGAGPRLPAHARAHLERRRRAGHRGPGARPGRGDPGGRAGRRGRLRRRAAARRLGAAAPARPARRRGGAAPVGGRGRPGPSGARRRPGGRRSPTRRRPPCRRWCGGTR